MIKNLTVPQSQARQLGNYAIIVMVDSKKDIYINNEKVGSIAGAGTNSVLLEELNNFRKNSRVPADKTSKAINLVFDESIPYKIMKGVMHTSAIAGFTEFKLLVQGAY